MLNGAKRKLLITMAATNRIRKKRKVSHQLSFFFSGPASGPAASAGPAGAGGGEGGSRSIRAPFAWRQGAVKRRQGPEAAGIGPGSGLSVEEALHMPAPQPG